MKPFSSIRIYRSVLFVLIMAAIAGSLLFMLYSQREAISQTAGNNASEDVRVADMIKIARFAREESELASRISAAFESATDTVAIIEKLEAVGREANVDLTVRQADKVEEDGKTVLTINADAQGQWSDVYRFLLELDTFSYKHDTTRIRLRQVGDVVANPGMWTAVIGMNVYMK